MIGRALLTCDFDERWNGPPPRCESKSQPHTDLNTHSVAHCCPLLPPASPSLAVVECDTLPGNYYNTIISAPNGTYYGSKAEISCPPGYRMEGPRLLTCLATGQWSSALPRCIKLEPSTLATPASPPPAPPSTAAIPAAPVRPKIIPSTSRTPPAYRPPSSTSGTSSTAATYPQPHPHPPHPSLNTPQVEINGEGE